MNRNIIINCLLISLFISIIAPVFTMAVSYPSEKEIHQSEKLESFIKNELKEITEPALLQRIDDFERKNPNKIDKVFTKVVTVEGYWILYTDEFINWFLGLIIATFLVSYLNIKRNKNA